MYEQIAPDLDVSELTAQILGLLDLFGPSYRQLMEISEIINDSQWNLCNKNQKYISRNDFAIDHIIC